MSTAPCQAYIHLKNGKDLPGLDWGGVSDPYCKFICGNHRAESEVYYKDNNPTWNSWILCELENGVNEMKVEVWDKDMIEDDLMGSFIVPLKLDDLNTKEGTFEVRLAPGVKSAGKPVITMSVMAYTKTFDEPVDESNLRNDDDSDFEEMENGQRKEPNRVLEAKRDGLSIEPIEGEDDMFVADEDQGVEALAWMANREWEAPSDYKKSRAEGSAPAEDLALEYIYGIRTWDVRDHVEYNANGHIVYPAASVGVVWDPKANSQKHFIKHQDDILSLAIHPDRRIVATGELGSCPKVYVWDSTADVIEAKQVLCGVKGMRGIVGLAFSADGKYLAGICDDDDHKFYVWDWQTGAEMTMGKCGNARMFNIKFNPNDKKWWAVGVNTVLNFDEKSRRPEKAGELIPGTKTGVAAVCFNKSNVIVGTGSGKLLVLSGGKVTKTIDAHAKSVQCLFSSSNSNDGLIISCGTDGVVKFWNADMKDKSAKASVEYKGEKVITATMKDDGSQFLVLTKSAMLYQQSASDYTKPGKLLVDYHHQGEQEKGTKHSQRYGDWGELWGLALHPSDPTVAVSCGDDGVVRWWNMADRKMTSCIKLDDGQRCRSICFDADASRIAVGCWDGRFYVFDGDGRSTKPINDKLTELKVGRGAKKTEELEITDIRFSPDGEWLAMASKVAGSYIAVVSTSNWKMKGSIGQNNGISAHIKMLDWNKDSTAIQMLTGAWELLYIDVPSVSLNPRSKGFADTQWDSWTLVLGWPVQGIFPKRAERGSNSYDNINSCDRSHNYDNSGRGWIVCGDDSSFVRLFRYPCATEDADSKKYLCHSSHVCRTRFNADDSYVVSVGGGDQCVMQWKLQK